MELTPFAWLLVIVALILGFLAGYFKFKPQVPPLIKSEPITSDRDEKLNRITIPATGGTVNFLDATIPTPNIFQIQLPEQIPPREITFRNVDKTKYEPLFKNGEANRNAPPNPGNKRVHRIIIKLEATDAEGKKVEYFYPMMTTVWNYTDEDVDYAGGDPTRLRRFYNDGIEWIELGMPKDALDTKKKTLTAFVASFSGCGGGSDR